MWNGLFVKSEREAEEKINRHRDLEDEKPRKGVGMKKRKTESMAKETLRELCIPDNQKDSVM